MKEVSVEAWICHACRTAAHDQSAIDQILLDLQQYRMVVPYRFSDTSRFFYRLRAAARAAGFAPVYGPAAVRVIGQRTTYEGPPLNGYHLVRKALDGIGFGDHTEVKSVSVTLVESGRPWTMVEVRAMHKDELAGIGGVAR
jgi:hypothetical protein